MKKAPAKYLINKNTIAQLVIILTLAIFNTFVLAQELPSDLQEKIGEYKKEGDLLKIEIQEIVKNKKTVTRTELTQALQNWKEQNKARLSARKEKAKEIRFEVKRELNQSLQRLPQSERETALERWKNEKPEVAGLLKEKRENLKEMREKFRDKVNEEKQNFKNKPTSDDHQPMPRGRKGPP
ncbi:MAG: hypothetical protein HQ517_09410 [SAR324 cluster bacterium]|nr:hypothetical protein [SAR324 cluster bacterium]